MQQTALEKAAAPVLRRMARDRGRISPPAREFLDELRDHLFDADYDADRLRRRRDRRSRQRHAAFTNELELPAVDYLVEARLEIALRLLRATALPPGEAGRLVGLGEIDTFRETCQLYLGLPPRRLRELFHPRPVAVSDALPPPLAPGARASLAERFARQAWQRVQTLPFDRAGDYLRHQWLLGEPHLFELLSRESLRQGRRDPRRGVELAELALATVEGSEPLLGDRAPALRTLALARLDAAQQRAAAEN